MSYSVEDQIIYSLLAVAPSTGLHSSELARHDCLILSMMVFSGRLAEGIRRLLGDSGK